MPLAKEIKNGAIVEYNGSPVIIEAIKVHSPSARGAATLYKFKARNVVSKQKIDITLKGTESVDDADFELRPITLMYSDAENVHLLDQTDFQQYSLPLVDVQEQMSFVTEQLQGMFALIYNGECVGLKIPDTVELKVTRCDPGVKGNSATSRTKPAELETGFELQVPEYLKEGEIIKVDTRSGDYLSRV